MKPRYYQQEAVDAVMGYFDDGNRGHPVVVMPTGSGKTMVISEITNNFITRFGHKFRLLILSHSKEILQQNYNALIERWPMDVGLYSASLNSRESTADITVAGIQSVYSKPDLFEDVGLIIIDECHLINTKKQGMYRKFLDDLPNAHCVGLTATHFRLGQGYINEGKDALFTDIVYDLSSPANFQKLVDEGYLTTLIAKGTSFEMNTHGVKTVAGDFNEKDLSDKFDRDVINVSIVEEIVKYGKNYKKWLVFAIDIDHANHLVEEFLKKGIMAAAVHSRMDGDRDEIIQAFKDGDIRALINVNMLTTGFDEPGIDLIAMARPTQSPVLHVQSIGRGSRVADGKTHCLILDFAGNLNRLGPIDSVKVKVKGKGKKKRMMKKCPHCTVLNHLAARKCINCEEPFEIATKLSTHAQGGAVTSSQKAPDHNGSTEPVWVSVEGITYNIHQKPGKPSSLKVTYNTGLRTVSEWICLDHKGYAKNVAYHWVKARYDGPGERPSNITELWKARGDLKVPIAIKVDFSGKFPSIKEAKFDQYS